jgi:superfamily II DNA helicase RecQ
VAVLSPLNSIMEQQKVELEQLGLRVVILDPASPRAEEKLRGVNIVFTSPENVVSPELKERGHFTLFFCSAVICRMVLLAVDEAHLIIDWATYRHLGYGMLHKLAGRLPAWLRITILSATIPLSDYEQIQQTLMMKQTARHIDVHVKKNIRIIVQEYKDFDQDVRATVLDPLGNELAESLRPGGRPFVQTMIGCRARHDPGTLATSLFAQLHSDNRFATGGQTGRTFFIETHHGGLSDQTKDTVRHDITSADGHARIVLATTTLKLGVDFKVLGRMFLFDPRSISDIAQALGRMARVEGQSGVLTVLYARTLLRKPPEDLKAFRKGEICRKAALWGRFTSVTLQPCDINCPATACDVCVAQ